MKSTFLVVVGLASAVHSSAVFAQSNVVTRYSQWERRLRYRVNENLAYPLAACCASGDVMVGFRIGADGKPAQVSVYKSSGNPVFDRAAVSVVSHLGRVGPVPSAGRAINEIVLKLSYGDGSSTAAGFVAVAAADREERLVNERRDRALVSEPIPVAQNH